MFANATLRCSVSDYADMEPMIEAAVCRDIGLRIALGMSVFRNLASAEASDQADVLAGRESVDCIDWDSYRQAYRLWIAFSEDLLFRAERLAGTGVRIDAMDEFAGMIEEARCQGELRDLEPELPTIEEARPFLKPDNPRPLRYGT